MNFYYYLTLEYTHADQRAEPTESIVCVHIHILFKVFVIAVFIFHVFFSSFPFSFPFSLSLFFALSREMLLTFLGSQVTSKYENMSVASIWMTQLEK